MKSAIATRVQKHRANLRHKGLKFVQIWVPDIASEGFVQECQRQAKLAKKAENELEINALTEHDADLRGWE